MSLPESSEGESLYPESIQRFVDEFFSLYDVMPRGQYIDANQWVTKDSFVRNDGSVQFYLMINRADQLTDGEILYLGVCLGRDDRHLLRIRFYDRMNPSHSDDLTYEPDRMKDVEQVGDYFCRYYEPVLNEYLSRFRTGLLN
ncbi:hypothetical protein KKC94_04085 [Patescibacteria group bacterium]|nr:hypothetical protein [Patescibacteria group bacterium]